MISHSLSSTHSHSPRRALVVSLAIVLLAAILAGPVVSVASAQAANGTNGTNASVSVNTPAPAQANVPGASAAGATSNASQSPSAANGTTGTNATNTTNTTSAPGGNTSRLSPSGGTAAANQTALTRWVNELAQMNASQAKQAVENNPQKKQKLVNALQQLGVQNPQQKVQQQPRQVARRVAGVLSTGQTQANATNSTNASAGSGQVQLQKCSGGFIESAICKASNFLFGWVIGGVVSFVQGVITGLVNMIFGFPTPKVDGHIALFQKPTNQPWTGLYESWKTEAMPMGMLIWVLMLIGILFTQVFTSDPSTALKLRELRSRAWKVLFGILGSWAIGAAILFVVNSTILTIAPDGSDIASNFAVFGGSIGAAGAAGLLVWFFEGVLFLFIMLLLLAQKAMVFIMMWSLPVLIPLAAIDVGPVKYISKPARGIIDMFIPFIFMTLPMALVLRVGYEVVNALNQGIVAQLGMWASQSNTALILGFWIAAAVSPLFVFSQTGKIKGMAAGLLGASIATNSGGLKEKVEDAKERIDRNPPPNVSETTDINPDENEGTWGGALPSGIDRPSMLEAGTQDLANRANEESSALAGPGGDSQSPAAWTADSTAPETGEAGDPELPPGQPLPGGDGSSADAGAGARSTTSGSQTASAGGNPVVSSGDVTQVQHPRDLPTETSYQVGHVKDGNEFQPLAFSNGLSRSALLSGGTYNKLNTGTRKYDDEKLLLRSKDDGSYFDMDSMTYREQSYEQMSRDTSEDVLNS
jgi:hypothetical protein